jgi:hypothetical protein
MSKLITELERSDVYVEGKKAFADGRRRGYNPYRDSNTELAAIWWQGWDDAKKQSDAHQTNRSI